MIHQISKKYHVIIAGAGAMGLWLAYYLAQKGYRVLVVESKQKLASGPSTKNEGWVHKGGYHTAAIADESTAQRVSIMTQRGHDATLRFCPEAVDRWPSTTFALVRSENIEFVTSRWRAAGVSFESVSRQAAGGLLSGVKISNYGGIYRCADVSIDTRRVYAKLAREIERLGSSILMNATLASVDAKVFTVRADGVAWIIESDAFVCATGINTKSVVRSLFNVDIPLRYFRSHLIDVPRIGTNNFFGLEPLHGDSPLRDATCMHHDEWTIVGTNKDQVEVSADVFASDPAVAFQPTAKGIEIVVAALRQMMPALELSEVHPRACIKVDAQGAASRSASRFGDLRLSFGEISDSAFWALPGKMTEAPEAARRLVEEVLGPFLLDRGADPSDLVAPQPFRTYRAFAA